MGLSLDGMGARRERRRNRRLLALEPSISNVRARDLGEGQER